MCVRWIALQSNEAEDRHEPKEINLSDKVKP
jgi:hypothetical protein